MNQKEERRKVLYELLQDEPLRLSVVSPFICDYGRNIRLGGEEVFINAFCYLMDGAPITIGSHVFIGPY